MTEYVPEEAARRSGGDCGPQREDSSDSGMGVERMFSRGGTRGFFLNFSRGEKVVKFVFSLSKPWKQPFLLKFSKSSRPSPPCSPPSDVHGFR